MRGAILFLALCLSLPVLAQGQDAKPDASPPKVAPPSRGEQLRSLRKDFGGRLEKVQEEIDELEAKLDEVTTRQTELTEEYVGKLLDLVEADPKDNVALETLEHVLRDQLDYLNEEQATSIYELLAQHHAANDQVAPVCQFTAELELTDSSRAFLNAVIAKNKNPEARAWALFALATAKYTEADTANDPKLFKEAEQLFQRVVKEIPADATEGTPVDAAQRFLFELQHLMAGHKAPDFDSEDLDGKPVKLSQHRGKVTLLVFWATWCDYCADLLPQQKQLVEKYAGRPLAVVSISGDDDAETVVEHLAENPLPWVHWWNGPEGGVLDDWNVQAFPTLYVIDSQGTIRYRNIQGDELSAAIELLVKEAETAKKSEK